MKTVTALHTCEPTRSAWVKSLLKDQSFINPEHDARETKRRISEVCRVAGISGVAPLPRYTYSARGKATHTVNLDATGLCPSAQATVDTERSGASDMSKAARYASHYVGDTFAESMKRARAASQHSPLSGPWMVAQFPYWPTDKAGALMPSRVRSSGERTFDHDGERFTLSYLYNAWSAAEGAEVVEARKARELAQLIDAQREDMRAQRKGRMI